MFKCSYCGETFDEPSVHHYVEDVDGEQHYQDFYVSRCPFCWCEEIEFIDDYEDEFEENPILDKMVEERREREEMLNEWY